VLVPLDVNWIVVALKRKAYSSTEKENESANKYRTYCLVKVMHGRIEQGYLQLIYLHNELSLHPFERRSAYQQA
jgi:hypothetical protein